MYNLLEIITMYPIKLYFKNTANLVMLSLSILLNLTIWVWLLWQIHPQPEPIFLRYNILFGVSYIGEWWRMMSLPIGGLIIILVNAVLGWRMFREDKFVAQFLNAISVFCQAFLLIAAALLVFLNV